MSATTAMTTARRRVATALLVGLLVSAALAGSPTAAWAQTALPGVEPAGATQSWLSRHFSLKGYLRLRFDVFDNFDLDHGATPSTGQPLFPVPPSNQGRGALTSANMRLRLEPVVRIGWGLSIHMRIDVLDNLVLGSTPDGLPASTWTPTSGASVRAQPPQSGDNADVDSVRVKRVWGQVVLPFGVLSAGRMGPLINWGTGFFINSGACLDCDLGDDGDRIALTMPLFSHLVTLAFDFGASGPTSSTLGRGLYTQPFNLDGRDDVLSFALAIARFQRPEVVERYRRAGRTVVMYGLLASVRSQQADVPAYYLTGDRDRQYGPEDVVSRDSLSFAGDLWFGLRSGGLTLDLEAAVVLARIGNASLQPGTELLAEITSRQLGMVARARYRVGSFSIGFEAGMASGDAAPGFGVRFPLSQTTAQPGDLDGPQFRLPADTSISNFRFNPDYRVDLILWRRIIGTVTDAFYARPSLAWTPLEGLSFDAAGIASFALEPNSTPSGERPLGVEVDLRARWRMRLGFEVSLQYGVLFPLAGLNNTRLGLDAKPAQTLHAIIAYRLL